MLKFWSIQVVNSTVFSRSNYNTLKKQNKSYISETTGSVNMLKLVNISRPNKHDSFDTKAEMFEHNVAWCSQ